MTTTAGTNVLAAVPSDFLRFQKEPPYVITKDGRQYELGIANSWVNAAREFGTLAGGEASADLLNGPPRNIALGAPSSVTNTRNFEIYPLPDSLSLYTTAPAGEYRIRVPYIRLLPDLSGSTSNWFTVNAEEFIAYAACSVGFFFNHDQANGKLWQERAAAEVQDVLARDKNESLSGNTTLHTSFDALGPKVPPGDFALYRGYF